MRASALRAGWAHARRGSVEARCHTRLAAAGIMTTGPDERPSDTVVEAAAQFAAKQARRDFLREVRVAQRLDQAAAAVGAGRAGNRVAMALADAYLATPRWRRPDLVDATRAPARHGWRR